MTTTDKDAVSASAVGIGVLRFMHARAAGGTICTHRPNDDDRVGRESHSNSAVATDIHTAAAFANIKQRGRPQARHRYAAQTVCEGKWIRNSANGMTGNRVANAICSEAPSVDCKTLRVVRPETKRGRRQETVPRRTQTRDVI